jgi:hypothetical protein
MLTLGRIQGHIHSSTASSKAQVMASQNVRLTDGEVGLGDARFCLGFPLPHLEFQGGEL